MADKADQSSWQSVGPSSALYERMHGSGVSTGWYLARTRMPFVLRVSRRLWNMGNTTMMTARISDFLNTRRPDGPCLVVDLDVVRDNFKAFRHAMPDSAIFYAVKAN